MSINQHSEYEEKKPLIKQVRDTIKGQAHMRNQRELYIKKTSGMVARGDAGTLQYDAYIGRARLPNITQNAENGIIGLAFEKEPEYAGIPYERVTKNGRDVVALARNCLREVLETARCILVVDAPTGGGNPYIVEYTAECMVDWATDDDDDSQLVAAMFCETYYEEDDTYKSNPKTRYREYKLVEGRAQFQLLDEHQKPMEESVQLPLRYLPIYVIGSVDNHPDWDPIPLLPVSDCAVSIFKTSADHEQFIALYGQGTAWAKGLAEGDEGRMLASGMGAGAFWGTQSDTAEFGILESSASSDEIFTNKYNRELEAAEQYTVAITQKGSGVEAAESMKIRAATRHATIYTVLDSVSKGIVAALECVAEWGGKSVKPEFKLNTDFHTFDLSSQLVTALISGVSQRVWPKSVPREAVRKAGLTEQTDEEMDAALEDEPL